ncbi:MAG: flagellar hook-basal body complex protein FliE [Nitratireductor sp.]
MIAGLGLVDRLNQTSLGNGLAGVGPAAQPVAPSISPASFEAALEAAASQSVATLERAESASMLALKGGDIQARVVVDAVMSAEQTLQAAIAIRDKIVTAYLEISRMAI